ncbi:tropomyosin isoforms c/e-like [Clytia hemisphaerica]|uniref:Uncharacterized protein n=1 Tax=Clytia hemisphaerica TaxID=252671 RepID=A0A7M5VDE2_9CNID
MCAKREDMENVLKVKINTLLDQIETAHKKEDELKGKIQVTDTETEKEEKIVLELHAKLQALEETLREKELDNERLREKVRQQQIEADCIDEFKERTEVNDIHENFKAKQLKEEYGDLLISNKSLKSKASETAAEITEAEKALRHEEQLCDAEEERTKCLEREHADVTKRLQNMLKLQEDIKEREHAQKEKIRTLREKHAETETRATKLEAEVRKMESQLDSMSERLVDMKTEQDNLVCKMLEEKMKIDQTLMSDLETKPTDTHKAMRLRQHKE